MSSSAATYKSTNSKEKHIMKRTLSLLGVTALLLLGIAAPAAGQTWVTGTGAAVLAPGTQYGGLALSGLRFGNGLVINRDGTASGDFQTNLLGTTPLGARREITVQGLVQTGALNQDGSVTFQGTSSVDLGDGLPPLSGVPFRVTLGTLGIQLVLGTTSLPLQALSVGGISIRRE